MNIKVLNKYSFEDLYNKLTELGTPEKDIYITFGIMSIIKFEYDTALSYLNKAYPLESDNPQTLLENEFYLANANYFKGEIMAADKHMRLTLNYTQGDPSVMNNIGIIRSRLGDESTAKSYLQKACELMPGYMDAVNNLHELEEDRAPVYYTEKLLRKNLVHIDNAELSLS